MDNWKVKVARRVDDCFSQGESTDLMAGAILHELSGGGSIIPLLLMEVEDV